MLYNTDNGLRKFYDVITKTEFNSKNKSDIIDLLEHLEDCFESYASFENLDMVISYLEEKFNDETDDDIREMILDAIQFAVTYQSNLNHDFTILMKNYESLSAELIMEIIAIFECTVEKKYIPVLENICLNENEVVANEARNAIIELKSM